MNGEMQDCCFQCSAPLVDNDLLAGDNVDSNRKLKANGSHGEAPARKMAHDNAHDIHGMFQQMVSMSHGVQTELAEVKGELGDLKDETGKTSKAFSEFKSEVKEEFQRVQTNLDNLSADHEQTKTGLTTLQAEVSELKRSTRPSGASRSAAEPARGHFSPAEVYVQGFFDFNTSQGALTKEQATSHAETLLAEVPNEASTQFKMECRFWPTRRITFVTQNGGDCWRFRDHLADAISKLELKINGKELRIKVQEPPDVAAKNGRYWRAVYALKKQLVEDDDFFIAPSEYSICEAKSLEPLGELSNMGFNWGAESLRKFFPTLNILELRKATMNSQAASRKRR